nr:MAG TPA: hypothetical protein [Caudoviricetes sp.]
MGPATSSLAGSPTPATSRLDPQVQDSCTSLPKTFLYTLYI